MPEQVVFRHEREEIWLECLSAMIHCFNLTGHESDTHTLLNVLHPPCKSCSECVCVHPGHGHVHIKDRFGQVEMGFWPRSGWNSDLSVVVGLMLCLGFVAVSGRLTTGSIVECRRGHRVSRNQRGHRVSGNQRGYCLAMIAGHRVCP